MRRGAGPQVITDLPALQPGHGAVLAEDGDDQYPGQLLVPGGAEDPQRLQPARISAPSSRRLSGTAALKTLASGIS